MNELTENRKPEERLRRKKAWQVYPEQPELVAAVMARHGVPRLVARILLNRGLAAEGDILAFLDPSLDRLYPPFDLPDLEAAAARLGRAVRQGEPVAVYGDYDADGITATAVLHQFLRELGLNCFPYIPDRLTQGYGLKIEALKELAAQARLVVTVDCGISDASRGGLGQGPGAGADHHRPSRDPPGAARRPGRGQPQAGRPRLPLH